MKDETTETEETKREYKRTTELSLRDYVRIVLVRKWMVLLIFLVFAAASVYYIKTTPPIYESKVLLMRSTTSERLPASIIGLSVASEGWDPSQELLLKSGSSVAEIKLQLQEKYNLEFEIEQIVEDISITAYRESSTILQLTAKANMPKSAQALANTAAETYIAKVTELKRTELSQGVEFLNQQMERVEGKIQEAEQALSAFRDEEGLPFTAEKTSGGLMEKLGNLQSEQLQTEEEIELTKSQLQSVQELISEKKKYAQSSTVTELSPQIDYLQSRLVELQLELNTKLETLKEKDPEVIAIQQKIDVAEKQLKSEFDRLLKEPGVASLDAFSELQGLMQQWMQLNVQLKGFERKAALVTERIDRFRAEHPELIAKQIELTRLERQARVHEQTYMLLMDKYEEMRLLEQMKTSGLKLIDAASLPEFPISPKKKQALIIGIVFGLSLGIMVAFFLEYLDDSIKRKEDVERFLELPVMGTIPKIEPFDVPESALSWRELSTDSDSGLNGLNAGNPSHPLQKPPDGETQDSASQNRPLTTHNSPEPTEPEVEMRRRSKHRRGHRKRMQRILSHSLLYADRRAPVIENYRNLAANIRYVDVDNPIKSLLVTSSAPTEGKTITASNLAIIMAQSGKKVLLIDADLRRPRMHRIFQVDRTPGFSDLLTDETNFVAEVAETSGGSEENHSRSSGAALSRQRSGSSQRAQGAVATTNHQSPITAPQSDFIRPTPVENLFLLPCGAHVSNPGMLFQSGRMHDLIEKLTEEFDFIIVDSPPILSAADAAALSTEVDGTLMVIYSGQTKRKISLQAKETLENVNAKIIGSVLNNVDYAKQYGSYYYYYYYYRSYYYGRDEEEDGE